jgi:hypothetical protein
MTQQEASHLSVAALRGSGAEFESKVSHSLWNKKNSANERSTMWSLVT